MSKSKAKPAKKKKKKSNYVFWFEFNFPDPAILLNPPPSMTRAQIQALYDGEVDRFNRGSVEQLKAKYKWSVIDGFPVVTHLKVSITAIVSARGRSTGDGGGTPSVIPPPPP